MTKSFSSDDITLLADAKLIVRKNQLIENLIEKLANYGEKLVQFYPKKNTLSPAPKVNRGENYCGFPYLIMDYPRLFSKTDILAFRTLFWWGHFISCTLHLKGKYLEGHKNEIDKIIKSSRKENDYPIRISHSGNEWNHDALSNDYVDSAVLQFESDQLIKQKSFLKITFVLPIENINHLDDFLLHSRLNSLNKLYERI